MKQSDLICQCDYACARTQQMYTRLCSLQMCVMFCSQRVIYVTFRVIGDMGEHSGVKIPAWRVCITWFDQFLAIYISKVPCQIAMRIQSIDNHLFFLSLFLSLPLSSLSLSYSLCTIPASDILVECQHNSLFHRKIIDCTVIISQNKNIVFK